MRIIERNTNERKQDTIDLYNQIKPLLDQGLPITTAVKKYLGIQYNSFSNPTWYKELREYAVSQGYKLQR